MFHVIKNISPIPGNLPIPPWIPFSVVMSLMLSIKKNKTKQKSAVLKGVGVGLGGVARHIKINGTKVV